MVDKLINDNMYLRIAVTIRPEIRNESRDPQAFVPGIEKQKCPGKHAYKTN